MNLRLIIYIACFLSLSPVSLFAQKEKPDSTDHSSRQKINFKSFIPGIALVGYGVLSFENHAIIATNNEVKEEVTENIDEKASIDDFLQYAPAATVYTLDLIGVKGKNNIKTQTINFAVANIIMIPVVLSLKSLTHVERPDGSSYNSFPSGHTATAFVGAEFLNMEYQDVSPWYSVGGYLVAAATGGYRIYNDRHWLSDVVAGAGIGILSTKTAYLISPWIERKFFQKETKLSYSLVPFHSDTGSGVSLMVQF